MMQRIFLLSLVFSAFAGLLVLQQAPVVGQTHPTPITPGVVQVLSTSSSQVVVPAPTVSSQGVVYPAPTAVVPSPTPEDSGRSRVPSAIYGWQRFESVDLVQMVGAWELKRAESASDGAYHRSSGAGAVLRYPFSGSGLRIGYRVQTGGGIFQVVIDGQIMAEIDSHQDGNAYTASTAEFFLDDEYHLLDIISQNDISGQAMIGIDYVEVFQSPPVPYTTGDAEVASDVVVDVAFYELVQAPPTLLPSPSPPVPALVAVDVVVAYDLNANDVVDPNEGVRGISVRVVDAHTNNLLASAITDDAGFIRIQVVSERDVRLVVPLLGETELVRVRHEQGVSSNWNILIPPANLPGLIP